MDVLFRGLDEYSVDDRGRTLVPPSYKPGLTDTVVMGPGSRGQLWVYPKPIYEQYLKKLQDTPIEEQDDEFEDALGYVLAGQEVDFDKQGRLSIPPFLRRQADISTSAIVRGNGDRVELWKPELYTELYGHWVASQRERKDGNRALRKTGFRP
jgi:transcriptional regulator MraZ